MFTVAISSVHQHGINKEEGVSVMVDNTTYGRACARKHGISEPKETKMPLRESEEFKKLIDKRVEKAIKKYIHEPWWSPSKLAQNITGGLAVVAILWFIGYVVSMF